MKNCMKFKNRHHLSSVFGLSYEKSPSYSQTASVVSASFGLRDK
uniref:Uncharacterized protein n=1 Tax=Rhizophora mucronata TaxID=61149 RepID=A0A2P2R1R3_RHIMU